MESSVTLTLPVLNAIDVLSMGEEPWRPAVAPMSYGIEAVRGPGLIDLVPPNDGKPWDWAGVEGVWFGSYAFLELVLMSRTTTD